jgi:hypothetical protein
MDKMGEKTGIGNAETDDSQLSDGQKLFKGKLPTPTRMDRLIEQGKRIARDRIAEHENRMDLEGDISNYTGHRVPFRHVVRSKIE